KDLAEILFMGIQATEVAELIVPKTILAAESLLGPFIKNLFGFRHTLLMLNTKITRMVIARQSTPSPLLKPQRLTE
ncbi:4359_t:CDS:2, partial [Rhizophagus irregularis]